MIIKQIYRDFVQSKIYYSINYINKLDFLILYIQIYNIVFISVSILSNSFANADLILFDPQHILNKLTVRLRISILPSSNGNNSSQNFTLYTPQYTKDLKYQISAINSLLQQRSTNPAIIILDALHQIGKDFEQLLYQYAIDTHKFEHLHTESIYQKSKCVNKSKQLIHKGGLTGAEGLQLTQNGGEGPNNSTAEGADRGETANQRPRQRCTVCRKPRHKCNRYPDIVVNSNS